MVNQSFAVQARRADTSSAGVRQAPVSNHQDAKGLKGRHKSPDMDRRGRLCRASGQRCEVFFAASHCDLTRNGFHNIAWGKRLSDSEGAPPQVS